MTGAPDALPALLPMGLGDMGGQFNQVYVDTFEQIVLGGRPVQDTLDAQAEVLRTLMQETGAPCWAPDEPSDGPCPVN
jgi:multiple sugar transport system substrate-binding protein